LLTQYACRLGGVDVCQRAWRVASYLGQNEDLSKAAKTGLAIAAVLIQRKARPKTHSEALFAEAMEELIADFGEQMPHCKPLEHPTNPWHEKNNPDGIRDHTVVYLPCGLYGHKKEVYNEFIEAGLIPRVSKSTFYKWWAEYYWYLQIKKYIPFAKCDTCLAFRQAILTASKQEVAALRLQQVQHREMLCVARGKHMLRSEIAVKLPAYFLHLTIDGMDQYKTGLPHLGGLTHSKQLDKAGKPLKTSLSGCIAAGLGFFGCWTIPRYAHGADLLVTVLLTVIQRLRERYVVLPPVLFLQLDNCGRENKNTTLICTLLLLIKLGVFAGEAMFVSHDFHAKLYCFLVSSFNLF